jgi:hypothetical protein
MQRSFSGSFRIERTNPGWWRVHNTRTPHQVAWLRNARPAVRDLPAERDLPSEQDLPVEFDGMHVDWSSPGSVAVVLGAGQGARALTADAVQLQEPNERLYDALPLERFTPQAQRFWQRIFWLVRLPGARALLGLVARRRGA